MKKALAGITIAIVAIAGGVMAIAGITAPQSGATSSYCHTLTLSITAPATVAAGKTIKVTGGEPQPPAHTVTATLQSRLSTSKKWVNGATVTLKGGAYSIKWKAPTKKGTYKVRVRVTHSGASHASAAVTVAVQ